MKTTIPCPQCGGAIAMETTTLLQGARFACQRCGASIGLSAGSRPVVSDAMDAFSKLKEQAGQNKTCH